VDLLRLHQRLTEVPLVVARGQITQIVGLILESQGPVASVGEKVLIKQGGKLFGEAEVVGFRNQKTLIMPLGPMEGIRPGMIVESTGSTLEVGVGESLMGRVLDGLGRPMDGKGPLMTSESRPVYASAPNALLRTRIKKPMYTGIRAIDGFLTLGRGQRVGLFAGSGVGKSVTLGMIARRCLSDVNVIALIGERGREVKEFIEKDLGPEGLKRSVVVVATSDQPALVRLKASLVATTIAEYFRDAGHDVLLLMDSSTRLAMAQREIGLAVGEPPATKGYTPSVFAFLPKMFERAGTSGTGSITGLYTVLVEGDDLDDPIADAVRSILDGHVVLSRDLANKNHYPAIDVLKSVSRCKTDVTTPEWQKMTGSLVSSMAAYRRAEDLITIGAYAKGTDPEVDLAIRRREPIQKFLIQKESENYTPEDLQKMLQALEGVH
jgi:flagellum-specific ATP synthase